ncbi:MAG: hypothetical protein WBW67_21825, partial [Pseudolabrys sp.]
MGVATGAGGGAFTGMWPPMQFAHTRPPQWSAKAADNCRMSRPQLYVPNQAHSTLARSWKKGGSPFPHTRPQSYV